MKLYQDIIPLDFDDFKNRQIKNLRQTSAMQKI